MKTDGKSMRVLNIMIQWTEEGIEYAADQRRAELTIQNLGLKEGSKSVNILMPGCQTSLSTFADELTLTVRNA